MVSKRKLSSNVSASLSVFNPFPSSKKPRLYADASSAVEETNTNVAPESPDPYDQLEASISDDEQQPLSIIDSIRSSAMEHDAFESASRPSHNQDISGFLTAQGWRSINDPNNPRPYVLVPCDSNSEEHDGEESDSYSDPDILYSPEATPDEHSTFLELFPTGANDNVKLHYAIDNEATRHQDCEAVQRKTGTIIPAAVPRSWHQNGAGASIWPAVGIFHPEEDDADGESDGIIEECNWNLIGDDTSSPKAGTPAPNKLRIHLIHKTTKIEKVVYFKKIAAGEIDWNNQAHVKAISLWRRQIFRRHAFPKMKLNTIYSEDEEVFLLLMLQKIKTAAEGPDAIQAPAVGSIREAFNNFFVSKIVLDKQGQPLPPRIARDERAFAAKLGRKSTYLFTLREEIKMVLQGKVGGKIFVPVISEDEIRQYRESKRSVEERIAEKSHDPSERGAVGMREVTTETEGGKGAFSVATEHAHVDADT